MPVNRSGQIRRSLTLATGSLAGLLTLALTVPGSASAADQTDSDSPKATKAADQKSFTPEKDWMGSTIRKHEGTTSSTPRSPMLAASVEGVDVSGHQGNVAWSSLWSKNIKWAYVKATESTTYKSPYFTQQYNGSYNVGMIRGAYHFALPDKSSGAAQANFFVDHGGGWSKDGKTLPGALDMEYNPYGATCYGKSTSAMVNWIKDFFKTYKSRTGRDPVIYTSTSWWKTCTGNYSGFANANPLWVARYASSVGELPAGWGFHTMWQYTSSGAIVGDHDYFNGAYDRLKALANG